jgi:hypothetical protein
MSGPDGSDVERNGLENRLSLTRLQMTTVVVLDRNSYARCPKCKRPVPFFGGEQGALLSDVKRFASDALITMECWIHGSFDGPAGKFQSHPSCF